MASKSLITSQESTKESTTPATLALEEALEDVRQVRSYVDKLRMSHPVRTVILPLNRFALWISPIIVLYGVIMQWIADAPNPTVFGLSKITWIVSITSLLMIASGLVKYRIYTRSSQNHGYTYPSLIRRMLLGDGYIRILGSMITILTVTSILMIQHGHAHLIAPLIGLFSGSILVMLPLAFPLPEFTKLGVGMLIASSIALFVFPHHPFYKIAALYGPLCLFIGLTKLQTEPEDSDISVSSSSHERVLGQSETRP